jgi:hypothetical protein
MTGEARDHELPEMIAVRDRHVKDEVLRSAEEEHLTYLGQGADLVEERTDRRTGA